jgi:predicted lactoylglutathione lyase
MSESLERISFGNHREAGDESSVCVYNSENIFVLLVRHQSYRSDKVKVELFQRLGC